MAEYCASIAENTPEKCSDGKDNDGNGYIDWGFGDWDWEEEGYNRSDVTGDGSIDVIDIVSLVNLILSNNEV